MKTLGLIGGISWVSTIDYYRYINLGINERLGGINFGQCIIHSFNYNDIAQLNKAGDFNSILDLITDASLHLKQSGADAIVLCANTMHMHADALEQRVGLPVIHSAKATAAAINQQDLKTIGLLGTKFTMEQGFFKDKLTEQGINTIIPNEADRQFVHNSIFEELGSNILLPATKARYLTIINDLLSKGAEGIILGCTEIPLLISQQDVPVPVFDTARIHANAAVAFSLG